MFPGFPPEHANTARLNPPTRFTSCSRHERIGPTKSASVLCQTVAKRVGPAPQASKMMSASLSPVCGRAPVSLLTFTTSATLDNIAESVTGRPVNGATGPTGAGTVVGEGNPVVDVLRDDAPSLDGTLSPAPFPMDPAEGFSADQSLHAPNSTAPAARASALRRETGVHRPCSVVSSGVILD